jgi:hypothetical protein
MTDASLAELLMLGAKSDRAAASRARYYARHKSATDCATSAAVYSRLAKHYIAKAKTQEAQAAALLAK